MGWFSVLIHALIVCVIVITGYMIFYIKTVEIKEIKNVCQRIIKKVTKK